jgi:uncharacterized protein (TIGR02996 family)
MTTRDALEAAISSTPDDAALHSAYADFLLEAGDPRGEYIRLQLAAEDRNQPVSKLREYETAANAIRLAHEREWLGELWPFLQRPTGARGVAVPVEPNAEVHWRRGWIDTVRVNQLSAELVEALAVNPFSRVIGSFACVRNWRSSDVADALRVVIPLQPLADAGRFGNLQHFELGSAEEREVAEGYLVDDMLENLNTLESIRLCVDQFSESQVFGGEFPRLHTIEMTYNNPRCRFYMLGYAKGLPALRKLHLDVVEIMPPRGEIGADREPITDGDLQCFFRTKYLKELRYLHFRNGEFGDAGVEEMVRSGFYTRLKGLDLCRCNLTDDSARVLARHPHTRDLEYLHLDNNLLSPMGVEMLEEAGHQISPNQWFGQPQPRDYAAEFEAEIRRELGMGDDE